MRRVTGCFLAGAALALALLAEGCSSGTPSGYTAEEWARQLKVAEKNNKPLKLPVEKIELRPGQSKKLKVDEGMIAGIAVQPEHSGVLFDTGETAGTEVEIRAEKTTKPGEYQMTLSGYKGEAHLAVEVK
jgi:hypothetical protein